MAGVRGRVFVSQPNTTGPSTELPPSSDINAWLDDLVTTLTDTFDGLAPEVYGSISGAKTPYKPFIVGLIPPDVKINHVAIQDDKTKLTTVAGSPQSNKSSPSTAAGQSASGGKGSPTELVKTRTVVTKRALGNSIYNNLKGRGFNDADAKRLTPLLVGHASAELNKDAKGNFVTDCFNFGNVHSKGPGQGGYYYKSRDTYGEADAAVKQGKAKAGDPYDQYFIGASTLEQGTDRWVGATLGWKQVRNASNGQEFAQALRPDMFPESKGGNNGPYFTAGDTPDHPKFLGYGRNVQAGADSYSKNNPDPSGKDPNGILSGGDNQVSPSAGDLNKIDTSGQPNRADVMTNGTITTLEEDDPLNRTGRSIRPVEGARKIVVDNQVADLRAQAAAAAATPALYMLISPQTFSRSYEHSIDTPKGRRKHIVHMWLEKPMTISCKGVTAAQYIYDSRGAGGVTHKNRVHTISYRNLMSLVRIYKNNGYLYSQSSSGKGNENIRQIAMSVFIYFDGHVYIGSFDDFTITDTADKPYNLEYSFKFTVRYDSQVESVTDGEVGRSIGGR